MRIIEFAIPCKTISNFVTDHDFRSERKMCGTLETMPSVM